MRASPSGKAQASQACIRGFESRRPLHELPDPAFRRGRFRLSTPEGPRFSRLMNLSLSEEAVPLNLVLVLQE